MFGVSVFRLFDGGVSFNRRVVPVLKKRPPCSLAAVFFRTAQKGNGEGSVRFPMNTRSNYEIRKKGIGARGCGRTEKYSDGRRGSFGVPAGRAF